MAYDERSFLCGLAAGLTATGGRPSGALNRQYTSGTTRVGQYTWPQGNFDTFVFKLIFNSRRPHTIEYEYGPVGTEYQLEFRRSRGSTELETFYHVLQIPEAVPLPQFHCDMYFYERYSEFTYFDAYFMAFPYRQFTYPGSPEQVSVWMARTLRGFDL